MDDTERLAQDLDVAHQALHRRLGEAADCYIVLSQATNDHDLFPPDWIDDSDSELAARDWSLGDYLTKGRIRAIVTNAPSCWETLTDIGARLVRGIAAKPRLTRGDRLAHEPWEILDRSMRPVTDFGVPAAAHPTVIPVKEVCRVPWVNFVAAMVCTANPPVYATAFTTGTGDKLNRDELNNTPVWYSEKLEALEVSLRCVEALRDAVAVDTSPSDVGEERQGAEEETLPT